MVDDPYTFLGIMHRGVITSGLLNVWLSAGILAGVLYTIGSWFEGPITLGHIIRNVAMGCSLGYIGLAACVLLGIIIYVPRLIIWLMSCESLKTLCNIIIFKGNKNAVPKHGSVGHRQLLAERQQLLDKVIESGHRTDTKEYAELERVRGLLDASEAQREKAFKEYERDCW